ncbi:hypothetical protein [Streptomyces sp. NRRL S-448]|uniref:competence protein CoiA family protein n=1 Tax=Streptomyces sp. NRRL S-448 TaxID=1463907 RepID=UPI003569AFED
MPFTALHPDLGRLDATLADLGHKLDWAQIHKARPRIQLACPECDWTLHPKVSQYGVRFFCHDPGRPPSCELSNESWEHHMLKLEMAGAIRAAGWFATLEVPAEDGSWRADVMAASTDGTQRMAWEAQLSPITLDDIQARTDRYLDEGVRVCRVSPHKRPPRWISAVPAVRVRAPEEHEPQLWMVDDGLAGFDYAAGRWMFREEELVQFVRWALHGQVVPVESMPRYRRVYRVVDGEQPQFRRGQWWTSAQSAAAQEKHNAMRQRQELAREEREARQKQLEEEADRQSRLRAEQEQARRAEDAGWAFAVEYGDSTGADRLEEIASGRVDAVHYLPMSARPPARFHYAKNGALTCGFGIGEENRRWGTEPDLLLLELIAEKVLHPDGSQNFPPSKGHYTATKSAHSVFWSSGSVFRCRVPSSARPVCPPMASAVPPPCAPDQSRTTNRSRHGLPLSASRGTMQAVASLPTFARPGTMLLGKIRKRRPRGSIARRRAAARTGRTCVVRDRGEVPCRAS